MPATSRWGALSTADALLLKAAFSSEQDAATAWRAWSSSANLETITADSSYVLPQVFCHCASADHLEPFWNKIKGVYRKTWYHNQIILTLAARLMASLRSEGVEMLLLGDAALAVASDPDAGRRPIDRIALLVHPQQVESAARVLQGLGWQSTTGVETTQLHQHVQVNHRHRFGNGRNQFLQLQWRVAPGQKDESLDRMWLYSTELTVNSAPMRVLAPTDQILHLLALRVTGEGSPIVTLHRFAAIWRSAAAKIDWPELLQMAQEEYLTAPFYELLCQANAIWSIGIPPSIAQTASPMGIPWWQCIELDLRSRERTVWNRPLLLWFNYLRAMRPPSAFHALVRFPDYLWRRWP